MMIFLQQCKNSIEMVSPRTHCAIPLHRHHTRKGGHHEDGQGLFVEQKNQPQHDHMLALLIRELGNTLVLVATVDTSGSATS